MAETDKKFAGAIPDIYDDYLVPLIFECYARDLAERVAEGAPGAVLETAAGSGVVTRALAPRLGADAAYTVTDLNPPMLERAQRRQPAADRIDWQPADALALPFPDASFDCVVCQFGVMFFPDRAAGYAEARRVMRPGGRLIFNVWDRIAENAFADVVTEAAAEVFPDNPPRFLARTPHGYHDPDEINRDLRDAGFGAIEIVTLPDVSQAGAARDPAIAYCQGTPLRNEIEDRDAARLNQVTDHAEVAIARRFGDGPVEGKIQAHVVVARV